MTWRAKAGVAGALVVAACAAPAATRAPGSAPPARGTPGKAQGAKPEAAHVPEGVHAPAPLASSRIECPEGRGDCDRNPANGCETDLEDDPENCRFCGYSCAAPDGATTGCFLGTCRLVACPPGRCDADGRIDTGCEGTLDEQHRCIGAGAAEPRRSRPYTY